MANIFKENKLKEIVSKISSADLIDKIAIAQRWHSDFHEGTLKKDKETQREQAFNQDFFIRILGYSGQPEKEYSFVPKATTEKGQLPDAVMGYFDDEKKIAKIFAVVELKGASVSLDKPQQREGNMSPIQQAFKYKTQYRICPFVLVSNFYEFRLFQDTQLDYEVWTLDDLVNPKDDYFQFKKFYYLLNKINFTSKEGSTNTERLLSDIRIEQEEISKKFYKEYKILRIELLRDIYRQNAIVRSDIEKGIEKAQKIIDRIVFICFCEDRGLLPDNTLSRTLAVSEQSLGSVWGQIKGLFEAVDIGSEKLEIPDGYNGGLFKNDNELNNLKISDDILKKFAKLGEYNFHEDLSVNILGHIFEQSISDLEEIKNKVNESKELPVDTLGKRKKDGIFYTPDYVVDYIIQNSVGVLLKEKESQLITKHDLKDDIRDLNYEKRSKVAYSEYQAYLQNIKILDPACGSGAFLVRVLDYLVEENLRVGSILGNTIFSTHDYVKSILTNNIYGVDLNAESVEITKLSLWLKTARKGKKLTALDENIKCGNSLISSVDIAGNKAFDWSSEFREIMSKGGFDVVVGNPPYGVKLSAEQKQYLSAFDAAVPDYEIYYYFISKALTICNENGKVSFIFPNTFLSNQYGLDYRKKVLTDHKIDSILDLSKDPTFKDAAVRTCVLTLTKGGKTDTVSLLTRLDGATRMVSEATSSMLMENLANWTIFLNTSTTERNLIDKIRKSETLNKFCDISQGLIPYDKYRGHDEATIKNRIWHSDHKKDATFKPELRGEDVDRYSCNWNGSQYISYGEWLAAPRKQTYFTSPRILFREIVNGRILSGYTEEEYYNTPSIINAIQRPESTLDLKFILALVNSQLVSWYFVKTSPKANKGLFPKILVSDVRQLPIVSASKQQQKILSDLAEKMIEFYQERDSNIKHFEKLVVAELGLAEIGRKLHEWWSLSFIDFIKAIKIKNLQLAKKDELLMLFEKYKSIIEKIDEKIRTTDHEIDHIVNGLYGLTADEIQTIGTNSN